MVLPLVLTLVMQAPRFQSPSCVEGQRWVYVVEFVEPLHVPKDSVIGSSFRRGVNVVVLLDGTAVAPSAGPSSPCR